jgi:hypothetical protein
MDDGNLKASTSAGLLKDKDVVTYPPVVTSHGGFDGGSFVTLTPTRSPPPGISLSIINDDHPKVSTLLAAKSPDLMYVHPSSSIDSCSLLSEDFGELKDIWKLCLIGYSSGKTPGYTIIGKFMAHVWKCNVTLHLHDLGWLIFRFSSEADMLHVLDRGPYSVQGQLLVLKPMPSFFDFGKPDLSSAPVWVRFPNLPLECWSQTCLSKISSVIRKPIRSDDPINSMSRVSFTTVLIEVDLYADLLRFVKISMPDGTTINQRVVYEFLPKLCSHCHMPGVTARPNLPYIVRFGPYRITVLFLVTRAHF